MPLTAAGSGATTLAFRQPAFDVLGDIAVPTHAESTATSAGAKLNVANEIGLAMLDDRFVTHDSTSRLFKWINTSGVAESTANNLLLMLAIDRMGRAVRQDFTGSDGGGNVEHPADEIDSQYSIRRPLAVVLADWP